MVKKLRIASLMVLIVALVFSVAAMAEGERPEKATILRLGGEVTGVEVDAGIFGIHTHQGEDLRISVDESTRFLSRTAEIDGLEDLQVGMKVLVKVQEDANGVLLAKIVAHVEPDERPDIKRLAGKIVALDPGAGSLTIEKRNAEQLTVLTNEETRYDSWDGSIQGFDDLEIDMLVLVGYEQNDAGQAVALGVRVLKLRDHLQPFRLQGEITAIALDAGTFNVTDQAGNEKTVMTGERTEYRGEGIEGLADLRVGMRIRVKGVIQQDGILMALLVSAKAQDEDRPRAQVVRVGGEISAIGDGSFSVLKRDGSELRFEVSTETTFLSRSGEITHYEDLEVGMRVMVAAEQQDDGSLMAMKVLVSEATADRPDRSNEPTDERRRQLPDPGDVPVPSR